MGKVNESLYRMVRLRWDTITALERLGKRWAQAWYDGKGCIGPPGYKGKISINQLVAELIKREEAKAERSRRPRSRAKSIREVRDGQPTQRRQEAGGPVPRPLSGAPDHCIQ